MSQSRFTSKEAKDCYDAVTEIMKAMPKKKACEFIGHFNDTLIFLSEAEKELKNLKK